MRGNHTLMFLSLSSPLSKNKYIKSKTKKTLIPIVPGLLGDSLLKREEEMILEMFSQVAQVFPVQNPCALHFEKAKLKTSVWSTESFINQEGANRKMGNLVVPQVHLKKVLNSGSF